MSRRLMPIRALLLIITFLVGTASPLLVKAQPKQLAATIVQPSRPGAPSLCPLLVIGIGLFVAAIGGFIAAALLERASRSAMHIALASRITLLTGLLILLIYCLSLSYLVLFR